jgi:GWxTD domain-containing protein
MHRKSIPALTLAAFLLSLAACSSGGGSMGRGVGHTAADLTNPFLGPERSSWLIGPIARIATPEEIQQYLALTDESQAEAFIEQFWAKRNPTPNKDGNPLRQTFEERTVQADKFFSESGYRGRRTDRGTLFVLYGPPTKTDFDVTTLPVPLEVWNYAATTPAGLDGKKPSPTYRFIKKGDLTVFYIPGQDPRLLRTRDDSDRM